jgi:hypothetical protein
MVRVALEIDVSSRFGRDLSPLVVHRHTDDLSGVRRRWLLQRTEVGRRKENGHAN